MSIFNKYFKNKVGKHWSSFEYFNTQWKKRIQEMSKLIGDDEKSVLDLGCGKMWLKNYLNTDIKYYGCDYVSRDENTIVCDFAKLEFPSIQVDVCFASGVLEYIENLSWFIEEVSKHSSKSFICSYCHMDGNSDIAQRKKQGWVNHFGSEELVDFIETKGFTLQEKADEIKNTGIYKFKKIN